MLRTGNFRKEAEWNILGIWLYELAPFQAINETVIKLLDSLIDSMCVCTVCISSNRWLFYLLANLGIHISNRINHSMYIFGLFSFCLLLKLFKLN